MTSAAANHDILNFCDEFSTSRVCVLWRWTSADEQAVAHCSKADLFVCVGIRDP